VDSAKCMEMNEPRTRKNKSRIRTKIKDPDKTKGIERD